MGEERVPPHVSWLGWSQLLVRGKEREPLGEKYCHAENTSSLEGGGQLGPICPNSRFLVNYYNLNHQISLTVLLSTYILAGRLDIQLILVVPMAVKILGPNLGPIGVVSLTSHERVHEYQPPLRHLKILEK